MSVVIGQGTQVLGSFFNNTCAVSAQWGINANTQRLYCLGSIQAYLSVSKPTETLSVTLYSEYGVGSGIPVQSLDPSTECSNIDTVEAGISVVVCGEGEGGMIHDDYMINQYQFSKEDPQMVGQETWSLIRWPSAADTGNPDVVQPSYLIRGISEGQATMPTQTTGVTFLNGTTTQGTQGSVQAGGVGTFYRVVTGQVTSVGAPSAGAGDTCNGSASIPVTPIWL